MNIKNLDNLLKMSLHTASAPSQELNEKTIIMMKEKMYMKKQIKSPLRFALASAFLLIFASISVYAAVKYLSAKEYSELLNYPSLARAFESDNSLLINETTSSGGYNITLLGTVFGKNLTYFDGLENDKTYAVVAIEKQNGKMPKTSDDDYDSEQFFISPLVKGYKPWQLNIFTMNGSSTSYVADGVMYRLIECDSVEMFADKGIYIGICSGMVCNNESFNIDPVTGEISANKNAEGVSVIFKLPIDIEKADNRKALEFLKEQNLITDSTEYNSNFNIDDSEPNNIIIGE